jgi:glutaredoxin
MKRRLFCLILLLWGINTAGAKQLDSLVHPFSLPQSVTLASSPHDLITGIPVDSSKSEQEASVGIELFMTSTCPHCHKADEYLQALTKTTPWITVHRYVINEDKKALSKFYERLHAIHSTDFSVPSLMFCESHWLGFDNAENSGKSLVHALNYCHEQLIRDGRLTQVTRNTLRQWSATSAGNVHLEITQPVSSLTRIIILAGIEAFSPCSLFCLLFLLAFFWLHQPYRSSRFALGMTFIVVLAFMHTAQFVWTSQYQLWATYLPWVARGYALILLWFLGRFVQTRVRSEISGCLGWAVLVVVLGVAVIYTQQQTCNFNVGAIFQRWLISQTLTPAAVAFYQATYLLFYLMPFMLLLVIYSLFGVRPRNLLLTNGVLILVVIDLLLLVYPSALASIGLSVAVLVFTMIASWQYLKRI